MALKPEDVQAAESEYQDAFNEPDAAPKEMSDDEAFGLNIPEGEPADESVTIDTDDTIKTESEAAVDAAEEAPADVDAEAAAAEGQAQETAPEEAAAEAQAEAGAEDDMPTDPKELQRMKSWEGRLRKREEELAAREAALKSAAQPAEPTGDADMGEKSEKSEQALEAMEDAVEAVSTGEMTPEQAMKTISEDFGQEFAAMLKVLIKAEADKVASSAKQDVDMVIEAIKDDKARSHFEAISEAHPDFNELAGSEDMKAYLDGMPEDQRSAAMAVIEGGTTRKVIKFLDDFKAWQAKSADPAEQDEPQQAPQDDAEMAAAVDAAEGVRSTGLRLPAQPARSDDYEQAWNQF